MFLHHSKETLRKTTSKIAKVGAVCSITYLSMFAAPPVEEQNVSEQPTPKVDNAYSEYPVSLSSEVANKTAGEERTNKPFGEGFLSREVNGLLWVGAIGLLSYVAYTAKDQRTDNTEHTKNND